MEDCDPMAEEPVEDQDSDQEDSKIDETQYLSTGEGLYLEQVQEVQYAAK